MCAALVFRESDQEGLRALKDLVVDRGTKHEAKGLAESLLGHERMPLIRGSYNTAGRLAQGIEALLRCAFEQGDRNLYLIGTSEAIFDEL